MGDDQDASSGISAMNIALLALFFIGASFAMYITYIRAAPLKLNYNVLSTERDTPPTDDNHDVEDPFLNDRAPPATGIFGTSHQYGTL